MNEIDFKIGTDTAEDLTMRQTVQRMQHDLATTGSVRAEHLVRVLGDPGQGVCMTLPTFRTAESRRMGAESMGLLRASFNF